ncbi:MAG TPA: helicase-related protein, partial [Candidatus Paceibacterota bacterium]
EIGSVINRKELVEKLIRMQFKRTNADLKRGTFRLRGDNWEIMPPNEEIIYNFALDPSTESKSRTQARSGQAKIKEIYAIDPVEGFNKNTPKIHEVFISPARHFITLSDERELAIKNIEEELKERLKLFEREGKLLEAERLERRTKSDLAMIREIGYCNGIENYSRHLSGRAVGEPPDTLLDYFCTRHSFSDGGPHQCDFLMVIDESHVTVPQLNGMHAGDASRKKTLIEYGFRLPSASDNRPLRFEEFEKRMPQVIYTSATPGEYELEKSGKEGIIEQIIRPTGLIDPKVTMIPAKGQVEDLIPRIKERIDKGDRVLVTTLTKKMAEDLSNYLEELKFKVNYLHSDVKTLDRIRVLTGLRRGTYDVIVGVNLLREGLDLPEVSLIAILDADKEGFLRSETSLIQTIGRAARNVNGEVLIYADNITGSIKRAVDETERRRKLQIAYNKKHNITPKTIIKEIKDILPAEEILELETKPLPKSDNAIRLLIKEKEKEMKKAAEALDFELASVLRDEIYVLGAQLKEGKSKTKKSK